MNQSASLRVGASRWSDPEHWAEVDVAKLIRVHISIYVWRRAGAVKGITGELSVANIAEVGQDSRLAWPSEGAKPSLVAATFGILDYSVNS